MSVAFSPDGRWLATASSDNTARLWTWQVDDMVAVACRFAARNLTAEEWPRYFQTSAYRKTCPQWPVHPSVTQPLRDEARVLAEQGDIPGAVAKFEEALALDPSLDIEPKVVAQVELGRGLSSRSAYTEAMTVFATLQTISPTFAITTALSANEWNGICWNGSLAGVADAVLPACERAVALAPEDGMIRDSRGLAVPSRVIHREQSRISSLPCSGRKRPVNGRNSSNGARRGSPRSRPARTRSTRRRWRSCATNDGRPRNDRIGA